MVNEEILTALRNAIEYGESLQQAVEILINSGYNESEVREASKFIGGGVINLQEIAPEEQLAMPEEKGILANFKKQNKNKLQNISHQQSQPQLQQPQQPQQPIQPQQILEPESLQSQLEVQQIQQNQKIPKPFQQTKQSIPSPIQQPVNIQQLPAVQQSMKQEGKQIKQDISPPQTFGSSQPLSKQLSQIKNPKPNYTKEIILIIILLILIGALAASIIFRTKILEFFTGYLK